MEIADLGSLGDGDLVTVGGIVGAVARRYTRKGEPYALFRLEDLAGGVDVVAFPNVYEQVPELVATDRVVLVRGRVDLRGRELQLRAVEIREPDLGVAARRPPRRQALVVDLSPAQCTNGAMAKLRALLEASPGETPVRVRFVTSQGVTPLTVGAVRVEPSAGLLSELRLLLGPEAVRLQPEPPAAGDR